MDNQNQKKLQLMTGEVEIDGKMYTLVHPGGYSYFKKVKELQLIDQEGYVQWNQQKVFDFCFGLKSSDIKVVTPMYEGTEGFVNWRVAGIEEGPDIPNLKTLRGVWALILPSFLDGEFKDADEDIDKPDEPIKWRWIKKRGISVEQPESESNDDELKDDSGTDDRD